VLLRVAAHAWRDAERPAVRDFRESFPHLAHLVARERTWSG